VVSGKVLSRMPYFLRWFYTVNTVGKTQHLVSNPYPNCYSEEQDDASPVRLGSPICQ